MALVKSIVGTLSGKLAGTVYSHNRGGQYIRRLAIPVNNQTQRQMAVRAALSNSSQGWRSLTDAQRAAWKIYAGTISVINRVGDSILLSGISMFNRLSARAIDSGGTPATVPPASVAPMALSSLTAVCSAAAGTTALTFAPSPIGATKRLALYSCGPGKSSQDPNYNQARLIAYSALNQASGWAPILPYAVSAGDVINLYVSVVDTVGRQSNPLKYRVVVVA